MKKIICLLVAMAVTISVTMAKITKLEDMPLEDRAMIDLAIMKHDNGDYDGAIKEYDVLIKKYPDILVLRYERAFSLSAAKRYDEAAKACRDMSKKKDCDWTVYVLWGSILDYSGKPNDAIKVYSKGIKRFPDAARLYLEGGTTYARYGYNDEAINWYDSAINADPKLSSAYYRAAQFYGDSPDKSWALAYAETFLLIEFNNDDRREEMTQLITKIYRENVQSTPDSIVITLARANELKIYGKPGEIDKANVALGFPGVYESCIGLAVSDFSLKGEYVDSVSINNVETIAGIRRGAVENYYKVTDNLFGDSMYLLDFQKRIIDAGLWIPYNYFLFSCAFRDESMEYFDNNPDELDRLNNWFNENRFTLDSERTVGKLNITAHQRLLTLMDAIEMQANLHRSPSTESGNNSAAESSPTPEASE